VAGFGVQNDAQVVGIVGFQVDKAAC